VHNSIQNNQEIREAIQKMFGNDPLLIVVDGPDGLGKTTQVSMVRDYFYNIGLRSMSLHHPNKLRRQIFDPYTTDLVRCMMLIADYDMSMRDIFAEDGPRPEIIVMDRCFTTSMLAYNMVRMNVELQESIIGIGDAYLEENPRFDPHLYFVMTGKPYRNADKTIFEDEAYVTRSSVESTFQNYLDLGYSGMSREPSWAINANQHARKVCADILEIVANFVGVTTLQAELSVL
jgi:thymidylate kinase